MLSLFTSAKLKKLPQCRGVAIMKLQYPPVINKKAINEKFIAFLLLDKRRLTDSNPRYSFPYTHFPGVLLQPLGQVSKKEMIKKVFFYRDANVRAIMLLLKSFYHLLHLHAPGTLYKYLSIFKLLFLIP